MTNAKFINACIQACGNWGILPTEFNSCMTWEEQVLWIARFLQEQVIPTVNENTEAFNTLKTYVENYFDNLDVQEEIDNKLDQMAEDGTLIDLIGEYLQSNVTWTFNTVAEMKAATNLTAGGFARTLGFYAANDGGGATYKISNTGTANEKDVIAIGSTLYANLIITDEVYVEQLGAKGDGTSDDSAAIQYAVNTYKVVKFHAKTYYVPDGIRVPRFRTLKGISNHHNSNQAAGTIIKGNNAGNGLQIYDNANNAIMVKVEGLCFQNYAVGIFSTYCVDSDFTDVMCRNNTIGAVFTGNSYIINFYNCTFNSNSGDGFQLGLPANHPISGTPITPNVSTFSFYSCAFAANGGHGINGWLRVCNFYGGFAENNEEAAVRMYSTNDRECQEVLFSGFDIEFQGIGYMIEGESRVNASYIWIEGGQISLDEDDGAAIYLKGASCNFAYVSNIYVNTRRITSPSNSVYDIYVESDSSDTTIQADINTGNRNSNILRTNLSYIVPNNLLSQNGEIPLNAISTDYLSADAESIVLPAGKYLTISLPNMWFYDQVKVTTQNAGRFSLKAYANRISEIVRTGSINATNSTLVDDKNVTTLGGGVLATKIIIKNEDSSDATITNIVAQCKYKK